MKYLLAIIIAFSTVFILTPILMKLAFKYNFTDKPTERKKHKGETPLCGGIAMFIGFFLAYFIVFYNYNFDEKYGIFIGALLILIIGVVDDYYKSIGKEFGITPRLIIQLLAAVIVFKSGISFEGFTNPFTDEYITLSPIVQFVLTITWIFGVTTVINWSDGMDGLAGGLSFISAMTFAATAIILGQRPSLLFSLITAGVVLAFLFYNKYPAKVFMGDSGANFLGFILSIIAFTITWIFGVTTVINWSDGMDGLAGGLSFISAMTFAATAIILGQRPSLLFSLITAGVVLAFLFYNKYPAKVFMGDSGANFLGFILSIIALDGAFKGATILSLMIPILALAVPIFDNIFVIFKRFSEGKPIYQADRSQIHYRLQAKGLNTKQIVNFISIISLTCSVISILLLLIKF